MQYEGMFWGWPLRAAVSRTIDGEAILLKKQTPKDYTHLLKTKVEVRERSSRGGGFLKMNGHTFSGKQNSNAGDGQAQKNPS